MLRVTYQTCKSTLHIVTKHVVDFVLPPRCIATQKIVSHPGMVAPDYWQSLDFITDPRCATCGLPFDIPTDPGTECGNCIADPPDFDWHRSVLVYNQFSAPLILSFKHADQTHAAKTFAEWIKKPLNSTPENIDIIMPVPLHRWRILKRRYNQSALVTKHLAKNIETDVALDGLIRKKKTQSQGHLSRSQRQKNVTGAFMVNPNYDVKGQVVLLIDDVFTTGSTLNACARTLRKAGAKQIYALTIAQATKVFINQSKIDQAEQSENNSRTDHVVAA